jgi:hypothetical protein
VSPGTFEPIPLADFRPDDRIVVVTDEFADTLGAARAVAGRHTIRDILLRLAR